MRTFWLVEILGTLAGALAFRLAEGKWVRECIPMAIFWPLSLFIMAMAWLMRDGMFAPKVPPEPTPNLKVQRRINVEDPK